MRTLLLCCGLVLSIAGFTRADDEPATAPSTAPSAEKADHKSKDDKLVVTHHSITLDGSKIDYDATAGTILMKDEDGKPEATFFFVSYVKQPAAGEGGGASTESSTGVSSGPSTRPITFVFNGGPGAAAVWLHMGCSGPQRVQLQDDGQAGPPPHSLVDNTECWLDLTDLVYIDPVGTGYSRPAKDRKNEDFYGVEADLRSVGDFIRLYTTRYQRWQSPKYLAGESYGTTRAAGLSQHLLESYGIDLNGIILISTVLNFETLSPSDGNDLPYALYLPTYASLALYHHKLATPDRDKFLDEVSHYAMNDYLQALSKGGNLTKEARADVLDHLVKYTGIKADEIDRLNLRIGPSYFRSHLLGDQRLILGRYDGRITGGDPMPESESEDYDPSFSRYLPVYAGAFNDYVRRGLKFESDLDYKVLSGLPWDFGQHDMGYLNMTESLRSAMLQNPNLRVLVASGMDDLATPFQATRYTMDHLDLTDKLHANVTQTYYPSGHMIYHDGPSRRKLKEDVAAFYGGK